MNIFLKGWYYISGTITATSKAAASAASQVTSTAQKAAPAAGSYTLCKFAGYGFFGFGIILDVGFGG